MLYDIPWRIKPYTLSDNINIFKYVYLLLFFNQDNVIMQNQTCPKPTGGITSTHRKIRTRKISIFTHGTCTWIERNRVPRANTASIRRRFKLREDVQWEITDTSELAHNEGVLSLRDVRNMLGTPECTSKTGIYSSTQRKLDVSNCS